MLCLLKRRDVCNNFLLTSGSLWPSSLVYLCHANFMCFKYVSMQDFLISLVSMSDVLALSLLQVTCEKGNYPDKIVFQLRLKLARFCLLKTTCMQ